MFTINKEIINIISNNDLFKKKILEEILERNEEEFIDKICAIIKKNNFEENNYIDLLYLINLPLKILKELAYQENIMVRSFLTKRNDLPLKIMKILLKDKDYSIRELLAERSDIPEELIEELIEDEYYVIREMMTQIEGLSLKNMKKLANDKIDTVKEGLLYRKDLPEEIVLILLKSKNTCLDYRHLNQNHLRKEVKKLVNRKIEEFYKNLQSIDENIVFDKDF